MNSEQKSQLDDFAYGNIRLLLPASPQYGRSGMPSKVSFRFYVSRQGTRL